MNLINFSLYKRAVNANIFLSGFRTMSSDAPPKRILPFRIPAGGKESNENPNGGNGVDSGELLAEGWKEKHASDSESIIKAERSTNKGTIEELQKVSVKHMEEHSMKRADNAKFLQHIDFIKKLKEQDEHWKKEMSESLERAKREYNQSKVWKYEDELDDPFYEEDASKGKKDD